jgi:carboxymethylenebutenolidase
LAEAGFVALAPNMLSRSSDAMDPRAIATAIASLPPDQTVGDLKVAFTFLQNDSDVDASKISSVGFGWGGWRVFKIAEELPKLHRVVVFYGPTPTDDEHLKEIRIPIQAHYAQYDFQITGNSVWTEQQFGKNFTDYIYPDTSHGFLGGSAAGFGGTAPPPSPDVVKLAWTRMLDFLRS